MIPYWFTNEVDLRPPAPKPYLQLNFCSVEKPLVVQFDDQHFLEFEITSYRIDDDGVGAFEYHGFRGHHTRPFVFVKDIELTAVNDEMPSPELKKLIEKHFKERRIVAFCKELPD